jgi:hypothetical protein
MHESESHELVSCAVCGAEISVAADRGFAFGPSGALCWECGVRRGGRYDALHERWEVPPQFADLLDAET